MTLKIEGGRDGEQSTVRLIGSGRSELVREITHQLEPCGQGAPIIRFEVQRAPGTTSPKRHRVTSQTQRGNWHPRHVDEQDRAPDFNALGETVRQCRTRK